MARWRYKVDILNISRVILFAIGLLVLRVVVSAVVASPEGGEEHTAHVLFRYLIGYFLDAAVVIAVFARLARVQALLPYIHAFCVVVLHELLGFAMLLAIDGTNPQSPLWLLDWLVLVVSVLLGTAFGRRRRVGSDDVFGPGFGRSDESAS